MLMNRQVIVDNFASFMDHEMGGLSVVSVRELMKVRKIENSKNELN